MNLENKKVFITGSTGFIGCRLAEVLYLKKSAEAVCLVHNFANAARLARLPVKMVKGDVLDRRLLEEAVAGCQIVFNCAFGKTGNEQLDRQINEEGTRNVLIAAKKNGVRRVVHISTIAVYGHHPPQEVDEETHTICSEWPYGESKLNSEKICKEYMDGLEVVIVRPTIVYGPFSPNWTVNAIKRVQHGGWKKVKGLDGWCSPIYIDDLIQGLLLCAEKEEAVGRTFILSGEETITWNEYFEAYNRLARLSDFKETSKSTVLVTSLITSPLKFALKIGRRHFEKTLFEIYQEVQRRNPGVARKIDLIFRGSIQPDELDLFGQKSIFKMDKAKQVLKYKPRFTFNKGIDITGMWLLHHGYTN